MMMMMIIKLSKCSKRLIIFYRGTTILAKHHCHIWSAGLIQNWKWFHIDPWRQTTKWVRCVMTKNNVATEHKRHAHLLLCDCAWVFLASQFAVGNACAVLVTTQYCCGAGLRIAGARRKEFHHIVINSAIRPAGTREVRRPPPDAILGPRGAAPASLWRDGRWIVNSATANISSACYSFAGRRLWPTDTGRGGTTIGRNYSSRCHCAAGSLSTGCGWPWRRPKPTQPPVAPYTDIILETFGEQAPTDSLHGPLAARTYWPLCSRGSLVKK